MPTIASSPTARPARPDLWRWALVATGGAALAAYVLVIALVRVTTTQRESGTAIPEKITTTTQPLGDTVTSALLGAAVLLLVAGAFYDRITKITGPGGLAVEFSPDEKDAAAAAVADQVKDRPSPARSAMVSAEGIDEGRASDAARDLSHTSITATLDVLQDARVLLKTAQFSPSEALDLARQWNLPVDAVERAVAERRIPADLWPALASRALGGRGDPANAR